MNTKRQGLILNNFYKKFTLTILFQICSICLFAQSDNKSEIDLKKNAASLFFNEDYVKAFPLYSQLVALNQKDANYNYRFGACMLFAKEDKQMPLAYLKFAAAKPDCENEVFYFLGRAYQLNYQFKEAINSYQKLKNRNDKKYDATRAIETCENGLTLIATFNDIQVIDKKEVSSRDFFRSYALNGIDGKVLLKPEEFITKQDIKKKDKGIMYISPKDKYYYFASYGKNLNNKDIFRVKKNGDGTFDEAENLGLTINTSFDEDYPFMHPDGKTLFFSSKGHNTMGGYDVFKTIYDIETSQWLQPQNIDFPINSPDDDVFFVTDTAMEFAYFASKRNAIIGNTYIYKVNTNINANTLVAIKGNIENEMAQPVNATIFIKDVDNGNKLISIIKTKELGEYYIKLPNGGNYIFMVEADGFKTQSQTIKIPIVNTLNLYKQKIVYKTDGADKKMICLNDFDNTLSNEELLATMLRDQSKLDINYNEEVVKKLTKNKDSLFNAPNIDGPFANSTLNTDISKISIDTENNKTLTKESIQKDILDIELEKKNIMSVLKNTKDEPIKNALLEQITELDNEFAKQNKLLLNTNASLNTIDIKNNKKEVLDNSKNLQSNNTKILNENIVVNTDSLKNESLFLDTTKNNGTIESSSGSKLTITNNLALQSASNYKLNAIKADTSTSNAEKNTAIIKNYKNTDKDIDLAKKQLAANLIVAKSNVDKKIIQNNIIVLNALQKQNNNTLLNFIDSTTNLENENNSITTIKNTTEKSKKEVLVAKEENVNVNKSITKSNIKENNISTKNNSNTTLIDKITEPPINKNANVYTNSVPTIDISNSNYKQSNQANIILANNTLSYPEKVNALSKLTDKASQLKSNINLNNWYINKLNNDITIAEVNKKNTFDANAKKVYESEIESIKNIKIKKNTEISNAIKELNTMGIIDASNTLPIANNNLIDGNVNKNNIIVSEKSIVIGEVGVKRNNVNNKEIVAAKISESPIKNIDIIEKEKIFVLPNNTNSNAEFVNNTAEDLLPIQTDVEFEVKYTNKNVRNDLANYKTNFNKVINLQASKTEIEKDVSILDSVKNSSNIKAINDSINFYLSENNTAQFAANNKEIVSNFYKVQQYQQYCTAQKNDQYFIAEVLVDEAQNFYKEAQSLKSKNDNTTFSIISPALITLQEQILILEAKAIKKMQLANNIYAQSNSDTAQAIDKRADNNFETYYSKIKPTITSSIAFKNYSATKETPTTNTTIFNTTTIYKNKESAASVNYTKSLMSAYKLKRSLANNNTEKAIYTIKIDSLQKILSNNMSTFNVTSNENNTSNKFIQSITTDKTMQNFVVNNVANYSLNNTIPMNTDLPLGLVFKVQIGAFKKPVPSNVFKGFKPLSGEANPNSLYIRYMAGLFYSYTNAKEARSEIRGFGYADAFVVAYYNGKRISYSQAQNIMQQNNALVSTTSKQEIVELNNFIENKEPIKNTTNQNVVTSQPVVNVTNDVKSIEINSLQGLFYTVQVGVYAKKVTANQLYNIQPLFVETTSNNMLRYTSCTFNSLDLAKQAKQLVNNFGVADAFISAYYNGTRISISEAKKIIDTNNNVFIKTPSLNTLPSQTTIAEIENR